MWVHEREREIEIEEIWLSLKLAVILSVRLNQFIFRKDQLDRVSSNALQD